MMVSEWIAIFRGYFAMPIAGMAFIAFGLTAIAIIAYRITRAIRAPLPLAGVFTLSFMFASLTIEKGSEPQMTALFLAVLVGVGRVIYERTLAE